LDRRILYAITGVLAVIVIVLELQLEHEPDPSMGINIDIGKNGLTIQKKNGD
jgi:hypothetical protein